MTIISAGRVLPINPLGDWSNQIHNPNTARLDIRQQHNLGHRYVEEVYGQRSLPSSDLWSRLTPISTNTGNRHLISWSGIPSHHLHSFNWDTPTNSLRNFKYLRQKSEKKSKKKMETCLSCNDDTRTTTSRPWCLDRTVPLIASSCLGVSRWAALPNIIAWPPVSRLGFMASFQFSWRLSLSFFLFSSPCIQPG